MKDWLLERALLDEVPEGHRAQAEHARGDEEVAARERALRASNERILRDLPPAAVAAEIERRLRIARIERERQRGRARRRFAWLVPVAAAAAVLFALWLRGDAPTTEDGVRAKGDSQLQVHRQLGDGAERLRPGSALSEGDRLQLGYVAAGRRYGVILSIDGRGAVTLHHPQHLGGAAQLEQGGAVALPFAYELDDAPGFERFFFVTADRPFDVAIVQRAAAVLAADPLRAPTAPLALPSDFAQKSYSFRKGPPR